MKQTYFTYYSLLFAQFVVEKIIIWNYLKGNYLLVFPGVCRMNCSFAFFILPFQVFFTPVLS